MEGWLNAYQFEKQYGLSRYTVAGWAQHLAKPGEIREMKGASGRERPHFHPRLVARLVKRQILQQKLQKSPRGYTAQEAAEVLGVSKSFAERFLRQRNVPRTPVMAPNGHLVSGYLASQVRTLAKELPPLADDNFVNKQQIADLTGWTHRTVGIRLSAACLEPVLLRSPLTGHALDFYLLDEALRAVGKRAKDYPAGGDWYTANAIALLIERPFDWVAIRLDRKFSHASQWRLDDFNRPKQHYPPAVLTALRIESIHSPSKKAS